MRRVTLVCGPPCAGKSTLVNREASPGARVVDFDEVAAASGSAGKWQQTPAQGDATERRVQQLLDEIAESTAGEAWAIRCAPEPGVRLELAARLHADRVVVLKPPLSVLLQRADNRPLPRETRAAVMRWMDRYGPAACDELVR